MRLATYLSAAVMTFGMAQGVVNPEAEGACDETTGGENACGPNGSEAWLNRGIDTETGWRPPYVNMSSIVLGDLKKIYKVAHICKYRYKYFRWSGAKYNIPSDILALLSWQETGCSLSGKHTGLVKCGRECLRGWCRYPVEENVDCAARIIRIGLDLHDQNAIAAIGYYHGYFTEGSVYNDNKGIDEKYPCSAEGLDGGPPQNLGVLHETLNGYFQGHDLRKKKELRGKYQCRGNCTEGSIC